jgi:hypothetical protein
MLRSIFEYFAPPAITDRPAFARFLSGEASYLAQRSTYEFARNTLAYFGQHQFADERFNDAFRVCRWEAFAAILGGMVILAEGRLRSHAAAQPAALRAGLLALYADMLAEYPVPAHRATGWDEQIAALEDQLTRAQADVPAAPAIVAKPVARRVYDVLPLYSHNAEYDRRIIDNAMSFGLIAFNDRLVRRLGAPQMTALLLRAAASPAPAA